MNRTHFTWCDVHCGPIRLRPQCTQPGVEHRNHFATRPGFLVVDSSDNLIYASVASAALHEHLLTRESHFHLFGYDNFTIEVT